MLFFVVVVPHSMFSETPLPPPPLPPMSNTPAIPTIFSGGSPTPGGEPRNASQSRPGTPQPTATGASPNLPSPPIPAAGQRQSPEDLVVTTQPETIRFVDERGRGSAAYRVRGG